MTTKRTYIIIYKNGGLFYNVNAFGCYFDSILQLIHTTHMFLVKSFIQRKMF